MRLATPSAAPIPPRDGCPYRGSIPDTEPILAQDGDKIPAAAAGNTTENATAAEEKKVLPLPSRHPLLTRLVTSRMMHQGRHRWLMSR